MSNLRCARLVNVSVAFALAGAGGLAVGCGGDVSHGVLLSMYLCGRRITQLFGDYVPG